MKYKFCSIRINVTKYDVDICPKGRVLTPNPPEGASEGMQKARF